MPSIKFYNFIIVNFSIILDVALYGAEKSCITLYNKQKFETKKGS